jgi:hypothetical protein
MKDEKYKVMIKACKECGKEFEMRIPIRIHEATRPLRSRTSVVSSRMFGRPLDAWRWSKFWEQ